MPGALHPVIAAWLCSAAYVADNVEGPAFRPGLNLGGVDEPSKQNAGRPAKGDLRVCGTAFL